MILYFHFSDAMYEYPLPAGDNRRVRLDLTGAANIDVGIIDLEVWDGVWHLLSNEVIALSRDQQALQDHVLCGGDVIDAYDKSASVPFTVTVGDADDAFAIYDKFSLANVDTIEIGSDETCSIVVRSEFASRRHATLRRTGGKAILTDHSTNGTYVNNKRVYGEYELDTLDVVYISGVKLIYLDELLAANQAEKRTVRLPTFQPASQQDAASIPHHGTLIRSPRIEEPLETEPIELESPPAPQQQRRQPAIFTIGPALTMPLPILASVLVSMNQGSNVMMSTALSVLLSSAVAVGWAVANMLYMRRMAAKEETHRREAYAAYLEENEDLLMERHNKDAAILKGQHLRLDELNAVLVHNKAVLWNRNVNHSDFLSVRLGTGPVRFPSEIVTPKRRFSLVKDPLQQEPHRLKEKYRLLQDAPSLIDLSEMKILGMLGDRAEVRRIGASLAIQIATMHCYTDVKLAFVLHPDEEAAYDWAAALPHVRWQDDKVRLVGGSDGARQNVLFHLNSVLRGRWEQERGTGETRLLPHFVVFVTAPELIASEHISRYMDGDETHGVTFVLLYEQIGLLPNACRHVIQADDVFNGYYRLDRGREDTSAIRFDRTDMRTLHRLARTVGGYSVAEFATGEIPGTISFLELTGLHRVEEWDLLKRWKENHAHESLRALIGVAAGGKPQYLDIHEKQHGPHGLIAGTTGSGKSETIQTYILSLVMNFHPTEVALILIDYKGGGMANVFAGRREDGTPFRLPHIAGTITNLDGGQTMRALRSIKAEIVRRQTLFNQTGINHIDDYARYFRSGAAVEPLPHLIIVSDEFAELKKEQPEFIKELVSAARVGRSLGVHLILATQKPSGVVDDEIWSNARFKLCLRVQDKQDSNEMLHRPDAAFLTQTGRAYLQIGNDELFEMFQSGYSGAHYDPESAAAAESELTMVGPDGSALLVRAKRLRADNRTQLSAMVRYICDTASEHGVADTRLLWLPELSEGITLQDVLLGYPIPAREGVTAVLGLIDNPSGQVQSAATIDVMHSGNLLIAGMPGAGKSTLMQTMLYDLVLHYPAEELNFYCADCSGSMSRVFAELPHCGGVVSADDAERMTRLFQLMSTLLKERSVLFDRLAVSSYDEYKRVSDEPLPLILLMIDNLFAFTERYPQIADEQLPSLAAGCNRFGVHLIVSVNHMSDVRFKLRQGFHRVLPLQLAERGDYHDALGVMPEFMPPVKKGRGLWGKDCLEFQGALAEGGETEQLRAAAMRAEFTLLPRNEYRAVPIRFIPKDQLYSEFLATRHLPNAIPIGYDASDISVVSLPLADTYCYAVSAVSRKNRENTMNNLMDAAAFLGGKRHVVALKAAPRETERFDVVYRNGESLLALLKLLEGEFRSRVAIRKQLGEGADYFSAIREQQGLLFVFIDSMRDFLAEIYKKRGDDAEDSYYPHVETFLQGGQGLGIYFIAGFDAEVYESGMYQPACRTFMSYTTGIHIGGQLDKQRLFDIPLTSRDDYHALTMHDGLTMLDDRMAQVFIPAHSGPS